MSRSRTEAGARIGDGRSVLLVTDLLIQPPTRQSPPGVDVRILQDQDQDQDPGSRVWHGGLGRDRVSRALVLDALGRP